MTTINLNDDTINIISNDLFIITRKHYYNLMSKRRYWETKYKRLKEKSK